MKNDRYFPLEICFWAGDNLSVMIYQIGGVQLVGIYAVSYTHLDVYKRQLWICSLVRKIELRHIFRVFSPIL